MRKKGLCRVFVMLWRTHGSVVARFLNYTNCITPLNHAQETDAAWPPRPSAFWVQFRSNRSAFITFVHAATKSPTNF